MGNEICTLPLVYQCALCEWRWTEDQPQTYTHFDVPVVFTGAGACPACSGPKAVELAKAS
jgi:hypothetical protein